MKYDILNPGDTQAPHRHPFGTEVIVIIKGKVKHQLDGEVFMLAEGDFIIMDNNVVEAVLEVYEPTISVVVRTPSVPDNKVDE